MKTRPLPSGQEKARMEEQLRRFAKLSERERKAVLALGDAKFKQRVLGWRHPQFPDILGSQARPVRPLVPRRPRAREQSPRRTRVRSSSAASRDGPDDPDGEPPGIDAEPGPAGHFGVPQNGFEVTG